MKNIVIAVALTAVVVAAGFGIADSNKGGVLGADINRITGSMTNTSVSVLATSTAILTANSGRQYAAIVNDSANTIYLGFGETAVSGEGVRLNANGGTYEINNSNLYIGAVNGISSATSSVTVLEK